MSNHKDFYFKGEVKTSTVKEHDKILAGSDLSHVIKKNLA